MAAAGFLFHSLCGLFATFPTPYNCKSNVSSALLNKTVPSFHLLLTLSWCNLARVLSYGIAVGCVPSFVLLFLCVWFVCCCCFCCCFVLFCFFVVVFFVVVFFFFGGGGGNQMWATCLYINVTSSFYVHTLHKLVIMKTEPCQIGHKT